MDIVIVALDRCLGSALLGFADLLTSSNRILSRTGLIDAPFRITTASQDGAPVVDGFGRRLQVDAALSDLQNCAAALVPGFPPDETGRSPSMAPYSATANWLRHQHRHGALVAGSCSGAFLLGEAGLLDGRRCTTTWWLHDQLVQQYPNARALRGAALSDSDRVITAGGPVSWIDIALHIIARLAGSGAARATADFTIVDTVPSAQSAYIPTDFALSNDPLVGEAERLIRHAGSRGMTAHTLAQQLGVSERTLHRRINSTCGETPKTFIDRVRLETAKIALETTTKAIKEVARDASYLDESSFRRSFKRLYGMTPGAYRLAATTQLSED